MGKGLDEDEEEEDDRRNKNFGEILCFMPLHIKD